MSSTSTLSTSATSSEPSLVAIAVTTLPAKQTYTVGEKLATTGMVVTGTYSDGTQQSIIGYSVKPITLSETGTQAITVSYKGMTTQFNVVVEEALETTEDAE